MPDGRFYIIRSQLNDYVMTLDSSKGQQGALLVVMGRFQENWPANQLWYDDHVTGTIRSKVNGYCLDTSGPRLQVLPYARSSQHQQWMVYSRWIAHRQHINHVLDIVKENRAEGAVICRYEKNGQANQKWSIQYSPPQFFTIKSMGNSHVLTAEEASPGSKVVTLRPTQPLADHQLWYLDRFGIIHSKLDALALDSSQKEVRLQIYDPASFHHQYIVSGNSLVNRHDSELVLSLPEGGTTLESSQPRNHEGERWRMESVS